MSVRSLVILSLVLGFPIGACAETFVDVPWSSGQDYSNGHAVFDTAMNPRASYQPEAFCYHQANFTATARWRAGDRLAVGSKPWELIYQVTSDSEEPLTIEIDLSHSLSAGKLLYSALTGASNVVSGVDLEFDTEGVESQGRVLGLRLQLYQDGEPLSFARTAARGTLVPKDSATAKARFQFEENALVALPLGNDYVGLTGFFCSDSSSLRSSWNRIIITIFDPKEGGIIREGTEVDIQIGGMLGDAREPPPLDVTPAPETSMLVDGTRPLPFSIPIRDLSALDDEIHITLVMAGGQTEVEEPRLVREQTDRAELKLAWQPEASSRRALVFWGLSSGDVICHRRSDVYFHRSYFPVSLSSRFENSAKEVIDESPGSRRFLWETNLALSKKNGADRTEAGQLSHHVNHWSRIGGGHEANGNILPATWRSGWEPAIVSDHSGAVLGMNDRGDVVGYLETGDRSLPFIFEKGRLSMLATPRYAVDAQAVAINENRQVVGSCSMLVSQYPHRFACVWSKGDLGFGRANVLPTTKDTTESRALDLNNDGVIVGYFIENGEPQACLWRPTDSGHQLEPLGFTGKATGINTFECIIANASDGECYLIQSKRRYDLRNYLVEGASCSLHNVIDINDHGEISGTGILDGSEQGILLRPYYPDDEP